MWSILSFFDQRILCLKLLKMAQWFWRRNKQETQGTNCPPEQQLHIILLKKLKFPSLEDGFLMEAWLSTICLLYKATVLVKISNAPLKFLNNLKTVL